MRYLLEYRLAGSVLENVKSVLSDDIDQAAQFYMNTLRMNLCIGARLFYRSQSEPNTWKVILYWGQVFV